MYLESCKIASMEKNYFNFIHSTIIIMTYIHIKHRQVWFYTLRRMALAFALIKQMLKLENRSKEACDFGRDLWIASRAATCSKNNEASLPQAP